MPEFFRYPKFSETLKGCPQIFSALWDQKISPENVIPFIIHETYGYPNFSETLSGCAENFSALWDKKYLSEKCDTPYYA